MMTRAATRDNTSIQSTSGQTEANILISKRIIINVNVSK